MEGKGGREAATEGRAGGGRDGQAGLLLGQAGLGAVFIRLCRATDQGAALPRQGR